MPDLRRVVQLAAYAVSLGLVGFLILRGMVALISRRPENLGIRDGELAPCPNSPNCVSTQSDHRWHAIDPIEYEGSVEEARERILRVVCSMDGSRLVTAGDDYVYAEFVVPGLRFIDDVEFTFDEDKGVIHFRSSSRVPYYDWNVNRNRMETIRAAFRDTAEGVQ